MDTQEHLRIAEQIVTNYLGRSIHLHPGEVYRSNKSLVTRCYLTRNVTGAPTSFIVKQTLAGSGSVSQASSNLLTEWASCLFLRTVPGPFLLAPYCYGGDLTQRIIVLEDLGKATSPDTTERLMGNDPQAAEQALMEHIRLLGYLHASTAGRVNAYDNILNELGAETQEDALFSEPWSNARRRPLPARDIEEAVRRYEEALERMGIISPKDITEEIVMVANGVEGDPGPFLSYCHGDQNGASDYLRCGDQLRLFDFDSGGFRHALLEGMPGRMTWGCMQRIPDRIVSQMDWEYRGVWATHHPDAATDDAFDRAMASAGARWHIFHVIERVVPALERDRPRGDTSLRQQCLAWVDAFVALSDEFPFYPMLGSAARTVSEKLHRIWADQVNELPYFPAFR